MRKLLNSLSVGALSAVVAVGLGTNVLAQSGSMLNTTMTPINGSGASGTSSVELLEGNKVKVTINLEGSSPNLPHAQHFHIGGTNTCPDPSADKDGDSIINTAEGQPAYGEVRVALTTEGAVDKGSALAVERMPKADANGKLTYERTLTLPEGVSHEDVRNAVVVSHGISELFGDKKVYDGEKKSSLDKSLPLEATVPSACGSLTSQPTGAASTGFGDNENFGNAAAVTAGFVTLGAASILIARRQLKS